MDDMLNQIHRGDCIELMDNMPAGSVDLAFADPPFNIGYDYDVYQDNIESEKYLDWSKAWMSAVYRVLKSDGTFWLAIGDEYAAELKVACREIGFQCRSWVVWYYTFGVNCSKKFTRSHAHLFYFVKDSEAFTFREADLDNRVPSARELVYNDKRANPKGRLPDDTWIIRPANASGEMGGDDEATLAFEVEPPRDENRTFTLRPQDLENCFEATEDTWYFPRVAGTFKERAGFHGCQMPEQLLGRIIRVCSNPGDVVLDPFSGSATTLAVAKKLGRQFVGFDISEDYVQYGEKRLSGICVGDRLDGSPEPLKSAPKTTTGGGQKTSQKKQSRSTTKPAHSPTERRYAAVQKELTELGVIAAFERSHDGFSADRVVADPDLNQQFAEACERLGLFGDRRIWNTLLFRLRKAGRLSHISSRFQTHIDWQECDAYLFASEIAWQGMINDELAESLDEILCDPELAREFDQRAGKFAPGRTSLEYRWAALKLRKEAKNARIRAAANLTPPKRFRETVSLYDLNPIDLAETPGIYLISKHRQGLYAGETENLRNRLAMTPDQLAAWSDFGKGVRVKILPMKSLGTGRLAWQSCLVNKFDPQLNCFELRSV